jgi:hypothetical protein
VTELLEDCRCNGTNVAVFEEHVQVVQNTALDFFTAAEISVSDFFVSHPRVFFDACFRRLREISKAQSKLQGRKSGIWKTLLMALTDLIHLNFAESVST